MSSVPFPKKGRVLSSLFLCLSWLPTVLAVWSYSTLLPWPELKPRTFQVCYRKLWNTESLVALWVTEKVGTYPCSHRCCGRSKCLCDETRWWNVSTMWRRFHLMYRGPKHFIKGKIWCWATHKAAPFPRTWSCFALSATQVRTASTKDVARSELSTSQSLWHPSTLEGAFCPRWCYCW